MARISSSKYKSGVNSTSGNLDTVTAGTITGIGNGVAMAQVRPGTLSAKFVVDIETNTFTMAAAWQVSDDGTTWVNMCHASQNPAGVILGTGTAGADASITRVVPAPDAASGHRFVRAAVVAGVDLNDPAHKWVVSHSVNPRYGQQAVMQPDSPERNSIWVTKRDGPSDLPVFPVAQ